MANYPGLYRGTVEDINDPQRRKRMRVRVHNIHPPEVPTENLPWAEFSLFGSKFVGDIPAFEPNDVVWVMFEHADRRYPVVMGGYFAFSGGIPDVPGEVDAEYERTQKRWVRVDRANNKIVMSPLPDERWIQLQAGTAELFLRQNDGTVEILAGATVRIVSPVIELNAEEQDIGGGDFKDISKTRFTEITENGAVKVADTYSIRAASKLNLGPYTDDLLIPFFTDEVEIDANNQIIVNSRGNIDVDAPQDITVDTPEDVLVTAQKQIRLEGVNQVDIISSGDVNVTNDGNATIDCEGSATVDAAQDVTVRAGTSITVEAGTSITIDAQGGNLDVSVTGNASIDVTGTCDIKSLGAMTIEATAALNLKSQSQVVIEAPILSAKGTAQGELGSDGICQIVGSLIQIG